MVDGYDVVSHSVSFLRWGTGAQPTVSTTSVELLIPLLLSVRPRSEVIIEIVLGAYFAPHHEDVRRDHLGVQFHVVATAVP
jgi:hypothetical protein